MFLTKLFSKKSCTHDKIPPHLNEAYCPDCGELIKNQWYITRCACCGVKLVTCTRKGQVQPLNHYCFNCGSEDFIVEELENIDFINVNYAALLKISLKSEIKRQNITQCWQEKTNLKPKLLTQFQ